MTRPASLSWRGADGEPLRLVPCVICGDWTFAPAHECATCTWESVRDRIPRPAVVVKRPPTRSEVVDAIYDTLETFRSRPFLAAAGTIWGRKP